MLISKTEHSRTGSTTKHDADRASGNDGPLGRERDRCGGSGLGDPFLYLPPPTGYLLRYDDYNTRGTSQFCRVTRVAAGKAPAAHGTPAHLHARTPGGAQLPRLYPRRVLLPGARTGQVNFHHVPMPSTHPALEHSSARLRACAAC